MAWLIPLLSFAVGVVFAWRLWQQFRERRRYHQLFWFAGMVMFAVATFGEFYGGAFGWNSFAYKLYYFTGVALPAFLGTGTVYLMARQRPTVAHIYAGATVVVSLLFLAALAMAELNLSALAASGVSPAHSEILPVAARRPYTLLLSMVGGLVLMGGALYSWLRQGLTYNRLIFLGALVFVVGGVLASRAGLAGVIPVSNLAGIALIFSGVLQAERGRQQAVA